MKRPRFFPVCKGQLDLWGNVVELVAYKRERIESHKLRRVLEFLLERYGSWQTVGDITGIGPHLLRSWHGGKVQTISREHAIHLLEVVEAHRKPRDIVSSDHDVVRRLPTREEQDMAHRDEQRAWRAYYRARSKGENPTPPGEKDTSRTQPRGRKKAAG